MNLNKEKKGCLFIINYLRLLLLITYISIKYEMFYLLAMIKERLIDISFMNLNMEEKCCCFVINLH